MLDTAGGEVLTYFIPNAVRLTVVEEDRASKSVVCNALITLHEREVLLSDAVIKELELEILSPRTGCGGLGVRAGLGRALSRVF